MRVFVVIKESTSALQQEVEEVAEGTTAQLWTQHSADVLLALSAMPPDEQVFVLNCGLLGDMPVAEFAKRAKEIHPKTFFVNCSLAAVEGTDGWINSHSSNREDLAMALAILADFAAVNGSTTEDIKKIFRHMIEPPKTH